MRLTWIVALAPLVVLTACDTGDGRELQPAGPDQTASILTTTTGAPVLDGGVPLTTVAAVPPSDGASTLPAEQPEERLRLDTPWPDTGIIDSRFTCDGADVSPPLTWSATPAGAVEMAIAMIDLDADGFVHWVMTGIDPTRTSLAEGELPLGAVQARTNFGDVGYRGPCPPDDQHEYLLTLYALGVSSGVEEGADPEAALAAVEEASIMQSSVAGLYPGE